MRKKRVKYSEGSVVKKSLYRNNIADLETTVSSTPSRSRLKRQPEQSVGFDPAVRSIEATASKRFGKTKVSASKYVDSLGQRGTGWSAERYLPKSRSSVTIGKPNKNVSRASWNKGNLEFSIEKQKNRKPRYGLRYSKRI